MGFDRRALLAQGARPRLLHQGVEAGLLEASQEERAGRHLRAPAQAHQQQQVAARASPWTTTRTMPPEATRHQAQVLDKARAGTRSTRSSTPITREVGEVLDKPIESQEGPADIMYLPRLPFCG